MGESQTAGAGSDDPDDRQPHGPCENRGRDRREGLRRRRRRLPLLLRAAREALGHRERALFGRSAGARFHDRARRPPVRMTNPFKMLSTDDKLAEIRRLYFSTSAKTIQQDLEKAL